MAQVKERVPAVEGWFSIGDAPALIGTRCSSCGNYAFPHETLYCRNPSCDSTHFEEVALSRQGRVWSFTDACYQPPAPYITADPFVPFCIAAVELADEKMVVMGQVVDGVTVDDLAVGDEVELVLEPLYEDEDHEYLVWKWRPLASSGRTRTSEALEKSAATAPATSAGQTSATASSDGS